LSRTYRKKRTYCSKEDLEIRKSSIYKSTLETKVARDYLQNCLYEPKESRVKYTVPHEYRPDFVHPNQLDILLEVKGYLIKGSADAQKYLAIIRDNPDKELVFIFSDPNKRAYPGCKMRKDGTYLSLGEWCFKHKILYFKVEDIPTELRNGEWSIEDVRRYKAEVYGLVTSCTI